MKCPNCYSNVSASMQRCPRCDWALKTPPPPTSSASFGQSPTANPWGTESKAAPAWEPESQRPLPDWDETSASQPAWETTKKPDEYGALPMAGRAPGGVSPAGGAFQNIPKPTVVPGPGIDAPLPPVTTVPLTGGQKTQLLFAGLLPILIPGGFFVFFLTRFSGVSVRGLDNLPGMFMLAIVAVIALVMFLLYQALKSLRDFGSGVALMQTARLTKTSFTRNKNNVTHYGEFAQLGKFRISRDDYNAARPGALYRVTYSPASKRAWAMQPELEQAPPRPLSF
ncbi:MAG: hypothetical protein H0T53_10660 [Herpetosiphonaceae bacterium]|nr:hypothetical protein [Herpetosiphonaceae bacterium]